MDTPLLANAHALLVRGTCIHKRLEVIHGCLAACAVSALVTVVASAELPAALDDLDCRAGHRCPSLWYCMAQLQQGSCTSSGGLSMHFFAALAVQQAGRWCTRQHIGLVGNPVSFCAAGRASGGVASSHVQLLQSTCPCLGDIEAILEVRLRDG